MKEFPSTVLSKADRRRNEVGRVGRSLNKEFPRAIEGTARRFIDPHEFQPVRASRWKG